MSSPGRLAGTCMSSPASSRRGRRPPSPPAQRPAHPAAVTQARAPDGPAERTRLEASQKMRDSLSKLADAMRVEAKARWGAMGRKQGDGGPLFPALAVFGSAGGIFQRDVGCGGRAVRGLGAVKL